MHTQQATELIGLPEILVENATSNISSSLENDQS